MPRYTSKNICATWSQESLFKAIESVQQGNSVRQAAEDHGIPRTTVLRRMKTPGKGKVALGGRPTLGELENELVAHVLEMEKSLFGVTATDLQKLAFQVRFCFSLFVY